MLRTMRSTLFKKMSPMKCLVFISLVTTVLCSNNTYGNFTANTSISESVTTQFKTIAISPTTHIDMTSYSVTHSVITATKTSFNSTVVFSETNVTSSVPGERNTTKSIRRTTSTRMISRTMEISVVISASSFQPSLQFVSSTTSYTDESLNTVPVQSSFSPTKSTSKTIAHVPCTKFQMFGLKQDNVKYVIYGAIALVAICLLLLIITTCYFKNRIKKLQKRSTFSPYSTVRANFIDDTKDYSFSSPLKLQPYTLNKKDSTSYDVPNVEENEISYVTIIDRQPEEKESEYDDPKNHVEPEIPQQSPVYYNTSSGSFLDEKESSPYQELKADQMNKESRHYTSLIKNNTDVPV